MRWFLYIAVFTILARPAFPLLDYIVNYDYISKVLCINKSRPQLHCNGKCHLMKELAKAAENERSSNDKKQQQQSVLEILFLEPLTEISFRAPVSFFTEHHFTYSRVFLEGVSSTAFRPPIV